MTVRCWFLAPAFCLLVASRSVAECTDYSGYTRLVAEEDTPGQAIDLAVSGDYAFVADNVPGIQVIDISDPTSPHLAATLDTPGLALSIAISGDYAYVADHSSGLEVVDIRRPLHPEIVGHVSSVLPAERVTVSGNRVYLGESSSYPEWDGALEVIDVTNPRSPVALGHVDLGHIVGGGAVVGGYAYVAAYQAGLLVVDVSHAEHPVVVASVTGLTSVSDVAVTPTHAYAATGNGVKVIDITTPNNAHLVGQLPTPGYCWGISVTGGRVFVGVIVSEWAPLGMFEAIDITDPTAPVMLDSLSMEGAAGCPILSGEYVYMVEDVLGLAVVRVSHILHPPIVGVVDTPYFAQDVAVAGDYAYVADSWSSLQIVDVSDPAHAWIAGAAETRGSPRAVYVSGRYAYTAVVDGDSDLIVFDLDNPESPEPVGFISTLLPAYALTSAGSELYILECNGYDPMQSALQVMNVTQPEDPQLLSTLVIPEVDQVYSVAVSGTHLYLGAWHGLYVVDIADPVHPVIVAHLTSTTYCMGIAVVGTHVYIADADFGLRVVDVADPEAPVIVGELALPFQVRNIALSGACAYLSGVMLQVVDITSPEDPVLIGRAETAEQQQRLVVAPPCVYLTAGSSGLIMLHMQCELTAAVPPVGALESVRRLSFQPNPSSGRTLLRFFAPKDGVVEASVFDPAGRRVRKLFLGEIGAGAREAPWDGCEQGGRHVAPGVYLVRVAGRGWSESARVVILR